MFDGSLHADSTIEYESSKEYARVDECKYHRIAHAPLVLPHIKNEVIKSFKVERSNEQTKEICNLLHSLGEIEQKDVDLAPSFDALLENSLSKIFSTLKDTESVISIGKSEYSGDGIYITVKSFYADFGEIGMFNTMNELNAIEMGLGTAFVRGFLSCMNRLFNCWTPQNSWHFAIYNEWAGCESDEEFKNQMIEEGEEEENVDSLEIISYAEMESEVGEYSLFFHFEIEDVIACLESKLDLFGQYRELVMLMLEVLKSDVDISDFTSEIFEEDEFGDSELELSEGRIVMFVDKYVDVNLHDKHRNHVYEYATMIDECAMVIKVDDSMSIKNIKEKSLKLLQLINYRGEVFKIMDVVH